MSFKDYLKQRLNEMGYNPYTKDYPDGPDKDYDSWNSSYEAGVIIDTIAKELTPRLPSDIKMVRSGKRYGVDLQCLKLFINNNFHLATIFPTDPHQDNPDIVPDDYGSDDGSYDISDYAGFSAAFINKQGIIDLKFPEEYSLNKTGIESGFDEFIDDLEKKIAYLNQ